MSTSIKKRLLSALGITLVVVPTTLMVGSAYADTPAVPFTGSLQNVLDSTGATAADNLNNPAFGGMTNVVYSVIHYCVTFIFQPSVITVLVSLLVIGMIAKFAWKHISAGFARGGAGRKKKRGR